MERTRRGLIPWLYYSHRSFFVAIVFEATALIWVGIEIFFSGHDEQWETPTLQYVNALMAPRTWGIVGGILGVLLLGSLYRRSFRVTRFLLACALWYILANFACLAWAMWVGLPTGSALQVRWALLGNLFVQVAFEPPENPSSD